MKRKALTLKQKAMVISALEVEAKALYDDGVHYLRANDSEMGVQAKAWSADLREAISILRLRWSVK